MSKSRFNRIQTVFLIIFGIFWMRLLAFGAVLVIILWQIKSVKSLHSGNKKELDEKVVESGSKEC